MKGSRLRVAAIAVFAAGLVAAALGMKRYDDAYGWVAHTTDVRLSIGRAVGYAGSKPSCKGLRWHVGEVERLTKDDPVQQARLPALDASVELVCAGLPAPQLVDQLGALDETERKLTLERRARLVASMRWTILALVLSTVGASSAVGVAGVIQRRALRALVHGEERFRTLASSSRDLVRIHDAAGKPTYVSPSIEHLLGYTEAELLAEAPLALGHPDDAARMRQALSDIQQPHAPAATLIYRLRRKDGSYAWFETHTNPVRDDHGNLLRFYTIARDVTERVDLEQKLEQAAVTDELTGLLNRRGFLLIAGQEHRVAIRHGHGLAVIFADLDGLKTINDRLGHEQGDEAIRRFAEILRSTFRESDVVARLGGDEYVALAFDVAQPDVDLILERVRSAIAAAPPVGSCPIAASLGVALLEPGQTTSLDELIARADERMYETKRSRRGG